MPFGPIPTKSGVLSSFKRIVLLVPSMIVRTSVMLFQPAALPIAAESVARYSCVALAPGRNACGATSIPANPKPTMSGRPSLLMSVMMRGVVELFHPCGSPRSVALPLMCAVCSAPSW